MLKIVAIVVLVLYGLALLFIFLYSIAQAGLIRRYLRFHKEKRDTLAPILEDVEPLVTVQLPVYNELYVVERLIDSVAAFEYPSDKFEIQVLDDSTDETTEIIAEKIGEWRSKGIDIIHHRRNSRSGFKAGALEDGLRSAKGEFVAIFDADFVPGRDFLKKSLRGFSSHDVGMVQTRWDHLNKNYSLLTRLQAFGLDAHFSIEQSGRNAAGCFMNFNGTAGVWRKECIVSSGNWQSDTLTEDLDLSYRAQLQGWKFVYLENVPSPAELPPVMSALKSQQYRWTKGGAEVARKQLGQVLRANLPLRVKWHAFMHLMTSAIFLSIITCAVLSVPLLFIKHQFPQHQIIFQIASFFLASLLIVGLAYYISSTKRQINKLKGFLYFLKTFPLFLSVSMGLSLHNAIAVVEGYIGRKTPFIRTPKFNLEGNPQRNSKNKYISSRINGLTIAEGVLTIYFVFALFAAVSLHDYGLFVFHLMLAFGFGCIFFYSIIHSRLTLK